jgi:enterochelin esterase-like enzyme
MNRSIKLRYGFLVNCLFLSLLILTTIGSQITFAAIALPGHAPEGFNKIRPDIPQGKLETITYNSKSIGVDRKAVVYTPPNYDPNKKYPILYLMHGIGGNETHWTTLCSANKILDNLIADKKAVPMIIVMPNDGPQPNRLQVISWQTLITTQP